MQERERREKIELDKLDENIENWNIGTVVDDQEVKVWNVWMNLLLE